MLKWLFRNPVVNLVLTFALQLFSCAFLIGCAWMMDVFSFEGLNTWDSEYQKMKIFIIQCVILGLIPSLIYIIFWGVEFRNAKIKPYLDYLKMPIRMAWMTITLILTIFFICVFCILKNGIEQEESLFLQHIFNPTYLIAPLIIFILLDLVPFIFFKPRP